MRIVSWNCNGKFREKHKSIVELGADIYVIQECENPEHTKHRDYMEFASDFTWIGHTPTKGLGIFAMNKIAISLNNWGETRFKYSLPVRVNNSFDLVGVWAMPPYVEMHHDYLLENKEFYSKETVVIGDFNSNAIWDKRGSKKNHSGIRTILENIGLVSAYHFISEDMPGQETQETFFLYRNLKKAYHIDYCFLEEKKLIGMRIGEPEVWLELSDHMPLIVDINVK